MLIKVEMKDRILYKTITKRRRIQLVIKARIIQIKTKIISRIALVQTVYC